MQDIHIQSLQNFAIQMAASSREIVEAYDFQTGLRFEQVARKRTADKTTNSGDENPHYPSLTPSKECRTGSALVIISIHSMLFLKHEDSVSKDAPQPGHPPLFVDVVYFSENIKKFSLKYTTSTKSG
ncbi:MAG TPA: hypothetical protein PKZ32_15440, partial [Candidatus Melainabacteria bacterium]|nr:hypothetical protein [Candidatus Melainabacteria bacterium]